MSLLIHSILNSYSIKQRYCLAVELDYRSENKRLAAVTLRAIDHVSTANSWNSYCYVWNAYERP